MHLFKYLFNRQYRLFHKKIKQVQASIWEHEFKIAKSRQIREGVRQDRDRAMEAMHQIDVMLKANEEGKTDKIAEDALVKIQQDRANLEENARRYELQMRMIDEQIMGRPAIGEDPGVQGIMDTIKALIELQKMYRDYASKL